MMHQDWDWGMEYPHVLGAALVVLIFAVLIKHVFFN